MGSVDYQKNTMSPGSPNGIKSDVSELESYIKNIIPFYDFVVRHDSLFDSCSKLLSIIFPNWDIENNVDFVQCKDGVTNKLIKCTNRNPPQIILVRAYGKKSELIIDRLGELINFVTLQRHGLAAQIYARFKNGFVYGFIEGRPLKPIDLQNFQISHLIAHKVALWHKVPRPGDQSPSLFKTLWKWFNGIPSSYESNHTQVNFQKNLNVPWIGRELKLLQGILEKLNSPIVFCHNDLLSANIIFSEEEKDASFIDFEYGCMNYRGFDVGNHFCEYAGFECNYDDYPQKDHQMEWLGCYWRTFYKSTPKEGDLESLYLEVNLFALASHFYWGLWGLVQASFSDIPFDYMSYAIMRFNRYKETRDYWLNLASVHCNYQIQH